MNNTTPIKALTAAALLTMSFGLTAHAAPATKGATEMNPFDCGNDGEQPDG